MARAAIPWAKINKSAKKMFPSPNFRDVQVLKPDRYNDLKAPTTVYDRATGNYAVIGYLCRVRYERFVKIQTNLYPDFKTMVETRFIPV